MNDMMSNFLAVRNFKEDEFNSPNGKKSLFSKYEARCSIQVDFNNNRKVSYSGYSILWNWDRRTVKDFINNNCLMEIKRLSKSSRALGILEAKKEAIQLGNDSPIILNKNRCTTKHQ